MLGSSMPQRDLTGNFVPTNEDPVLRSLNTLDLTLVKRKVAAETEWTDEKIDQISQVYRRFLFLCYKYPGEVVATRDVDAFWHRHILDTKQYARDCETAFGYFLHHDPHALRRNASLTKADLEARYRETHRLYEQEFGEVSFDVYRAGCDDCIPDYDPPNPPGPGGITPLRPTTAM